MKQYVRLELFRRNDHSTNVIIHTTNSGQHSTTTSKKNNKNKKNKKANTGPTDEYEDLEFVSRA